MELRKASETQVTRTPASYPGVKRDDERLEARSFGTPNETLGERSIGWRVELEESGSATKLPSNIFHRIDR